jgi:predicted small secreted protein
MIVKRIIFLVLCASVLTACNTVEGLGKDIEKSADWTRSHMP